MMSGSKKKSRKKKLEKIYLEQHQNESTTQQNLGYVVENITLS